MPLQVQGVIPARGPIAAPAVGAQVIRLGNMGDQIKSDLHGRYYESTYRGATFSASTQAAGGSSTTAGLAANYTGLAVINPGGSGVNFELIEVDFGMPVVNTAQFSFGLMGGVIAAGVPLGVGTGLFGTTTLTKVTPQNNLLSNASGVPASAGFAATAVNALSPTPVLLEVLGSVFFGTSVGVQQAQGNFEMASRWVLAPNSYVAIYTSVATTTMAQMSMVWAEVPQ